MKEDAMKKGLMTLTTFAALIVASAAIHLFAAPPGTHDPRVTAALSARDADAIQKKGRFKKEGDNCVWNADDSGPNQCAPVTRGRFKKGGNDSCTWDANDNGPDQCTPPTGRWKKGNNRCYWDPKDSGPNQCNPREARK
jgi:hypothetical protein